MPLIRKSSSVLLKTGSSLATGQPCCCTYANCPTCIADLIGLRLIIQGFGGRTCQCMTGTILTTHTLTYSAINGTYDLLTNDFFGGYRLDLGSSIACDPTGILVHIVRPTVCDPPSIEGNRLYKWTANASCSGNNVNWTATGFRKGCSCTSSATCSTPGGIPSLSFSGSGPFQDFCNGSGLSDSNEVCTNCDCSSVGNTTCTIQPIFSTP